MKLIDYIILLTVVIVILFTIFIFGEPSQQEQTTEFNHLIVGSGTVSRSSETILDHTLNGLVQDGWTVQEVFPTPTFSQGKQVGFSYNIVAYRQTYQGSQK